METAMHINGERAYMTGPHRDFIYGNTDETIHEGN
jgi:hypothetical protein